MALNRQPPASTIRAPVQHQYMTRTPSHHKRFSESSLRPRGFALQMVMGELERHSAAMPMNACPLCDPQSRPIPPHHDRISSSAVVGPPTYPDLTYVLVILALPCSWSDRKLRPPPTEPRASVAAVRSDT